MTPGRKRRTRRRSSRWLPTKPSLTSRLTTTTDCPRDRPFSCGQKTGFTSRWSTTVWSGWSRPRGTRLPRDRHTSAASKPRRCKGFDPVANAPEGMGRPDDDYGQGGSMNYTVKIGYESNNNASFKGMVDTGIHVKVWRGMSAEEQDEIVQEVVNGLVDVWVED